MIVPIEKDIVDLVMRGAVDEAKQRIVALSVSATAAQREVEALRERIGALERELRSRDNLSFDGQFYWTGGGERTDGPYCPTCFDTERLMMRLQYRTVEEIDYETGATRPGSTVFYKCIRCARKSIRELAPP